MKLAVLAGPRAFSLKDAPRPEPGPDEVAVRVRASGVCASELYDWQTGRGAPRPLGHEVAGEVAAVGANAGGFRPGDRVTGLFAAGYAEYAVATADRIAKVPDGIALEHAYGEPLACAVSAAERTRVAFGDRVAVIGLGFMGLLALQLLKLKGPSRIVGVDPRPDARALACKLGADAAFAPDELDDADRVVMPIARGETRGYDAVVEATGVEAGLRLAGELVRLHGVLSILGYHQGGPRMVDMQLWNFKAIDVINAHERRVTHRMECMKIGLALAAAGTLDLASLASHRFQLEEIDRAFAALESKPPSFVKATLVDDRP